MTSRSLWGELEPDVGEDTLYKNVDFTQMIELTMHQIPDIPSTTKPTVVEFPIDEVVRHTIQLHNHAAQLTSILEKIECTIAEGASVEAATVPPLPPTPAKLTHHNLRTPIKFIDKDLCNFALGKGPVVAPLKLVNHQAALRQCASLALAHLGVYAASNATVNVLADALDHYMSMLTQVLHTNADQEAGGVCSNFPDIICKTFAELQIKDLQEFYRNRIVKYCDKVHTECAQLSETIKATLHAPAQQLKLEEVPELHFPAAFSEVLTPSLEPGFQMLHSLEQEELQVLELLDGSNDDIKIEVVEYANNPTSDLPSPSLSPRSKKKKNSLLPHKILTI